MACTVSTSQLPKVVWDQFLTLLTWTCALRHNSVQFFISHLTRCLRTRRFSEPTFRPSGATNHWKNTVLLDCPTFSRTCIFFLWTLSLLWLSLFFSSSSSSSSSSLPFPSLLFSSLLGLFPPILFHLSILSEVWLLNFLRWNTSSVRIFTCIVCIVIQLKWIPHVQMARQAPLPGVILKYQFAYSKNHILRILRCS